MSRLTLLLCLLVACDDGGSSTPPTVDQGPAPDALPRDAEGMEDAGPLPAPDIDVQPATVTLVGAVGMPSEPGTVTVRNAGDFPLQISEIRLEPADARFTLGTLPTFPAEVAPGASVTLTLTYQPDGPAEVRTELVVRSDDPDEPLAVVGVVGRVQQDCLRVMPGMVTLGRVQPGLESGRFAVSMANCGDVDLNITAVRIEGDQGFMWAAPMGREAVGPFARSATISLDIWYLNTGLAPNELAQGTLVVESDSASSPRIEVELQARGDEVQGCRPVFEPTRLEYDVVRIGTQRRLEITVKNQGSDACGIRDISVARERGPEANTFTVDRGAEVEVPGGGQVTFGVTYGPEVADPIGDRAELHFDYNDPHLMENRRLSTQLLGIGAEALIGGMPSELVFYDVTSPGCASGEFTVQAANVGFVPLCVTGFRFEGDDCGDFVLLEEPDFSMCIPLVSDEGVPFPFVFQPSREGPIECSLVVTSDAMNTQELAIPLRGEGVPGPATIDEVTVGRLDPERRAYFNLSRPAVADSIQVFLNDMPNDGWEFSEERNSIFFEVRNHPRRDDELRIEFDAVCFDRR